MSDLALAYAIQDSGDAILRASMGWKVIGYKIAGTNPAARAHLKIEAPFFGRLYDAMTSLSPATVAYADLLRVHEPEIAIEIGRDLDPAEAPFDAARIEAATRAVMPAIEIIGTPFTPWAQAGAANLVADNAAHGHWIRGAPLRDWSGLDLMDGAVSLSIDGEVKATGKGRNVDAAWLANALAERGRGLKRGDYITTGSVTPPIPVEPGQRVLADFGPLGAIDLRIGAR